jgi:hypothetical protein
MTSQSAADVDESKQVIADLERQMSELVRQQEAEEKALKTEAEENARQIEEVLVRAKRGGIHVSAFGIAWVPYWRIAYEDSARTTQTVVVPAFANE